MYNNFQFAFKYIQHYLTASNAKGHGIHSPFVYEFITEILADKQHYLEYDIVENLRQELLSDQTVLNIRDLGAGSVVNNSKQRTISSITRSASKPKKFGQLLFRIIKKIQPQHILELGTSLGLTTCYLKLGNKNANVITLEGSEEILNKAVQNFNLLKISDIKTVKGNFDDNLPSVVSGFSSLDFCFVDGNHRKEPTVKYFQEILSKTNNNTILVFDDIHWSNEMEGAWEIIKEQPSVRCTIDLFFIGIVLFREEFHEKQHFKIRY